MVDITLPKGLSGHDLIRDHLYNKGTAFTRAERKALGIDGLLPSAVDTIEEQEARIMYNYHKKSTDIEKYIFLMSLLGSNLTLFNRILVNLKSVIHAPLLAFMLNIVINHHHTVESHAPDDRF